MNIRRLLMCLLMLVCTAGATACSQKTADQTDMWTLAKTLTIHIAGKDSVKYTNVKKIQVKKSSYTLKKGNTVTLRPKTILYDRRKKQLSKDHTKEFRYLSSNKKVAAVTADGKVMAKGTGECIIYVFAKNGCRRKIKIKVKK